MQVRVRLGDAADQPAEIAVLRPLKDDVKLILLVMNILGGSSRYVSTRSAHTRISMGYDHWDMITGM